MRSNFGGEWQKDLIDNGLILCKFSIFLTGMLNEERVDEPLLPSSNMVLQVQDLETRGPWALWLLSAQSPSKERKKVGVCGHGRVRGLGITRRDRLLRRGGNKLSPICIGQETGEIGWRWWVGRRKWRLGSRHGL